jgi:hypothetical protein
VDQTRRQGPAEPLAASSEFEREVSESLPMPGPLGEPKGLHPGGILSAICNRFYGRFHGRFIPREKIIKSCVYHG